MVSPGTLLSGRYRLDERIAGGGMGDVWRGTDELLDRTVAIKIMLSALLDEPGFVARFHSEARTMATISHPGVVRIYDFGNDQNTAYLIMEFIEGESLSRLLNRIGRLTPARTMSLIAQAAEALHSAHEKGVVHRDVKPGNLLVRPNGTLILTDFGIARSAAAAQLTATGAVLGTASYISPEQAAGQPASPASDVYALGVVAYQCLAGIRPYEGDTPLEIAMKHVTGTPAPLPSDVPEPIRQLVERAMAKTPAARWATAEAFAIAARQAAVLASQPAGASGSASVARAANGRTATDRTPGSSRERSLATAAPAAPYQRGSASVPQRPMPQQVPPKVLEGGRSGGRTALLVVVMVLVAVLVFVIAVIIGYKQRVKDRRSLGQVHAVQTHVVRASAKWPLAALLVGLCAQDAHGAAVRHAGERLREPPGVRSARGHLADALPEGLLTQ